MKLIKKITAFTLAILLTVSVIGCSKNTGNNADNNTIIVTDTPVPNNASPSPTEAAEPVPDDITSSPETDSSELIPGVTVSYISTPATLTCIANWERDGETYEMCLSGLPSELTADELREMIDSFHAGEVYEYTNPEFVDAEKHSNRIYGEVGNWVDEEPGTSYWGDSFMCWAGSTSDMLVSTGWASRPTADGTVPFANEDELFNYFRNCFDNKGGYQYDGICWYFDGVTYGETYPTTEGIDFLPEDGTDYCEAYSCDLYRPNYIEPARIPELLETLKTGGAVGICVDFSTYSYPLKSDPENFAQFNHERNTYVVDDFLIFSKDDEHLLDAFYTFDEDGKILILSHSDTGNSYTDDTGREYPSSVVLQSLIYRADDGYCYIPEEFMDDSYCCLIQRPCDPSDIDFDNMNCLLMTGNGAHALTASGYVLRTSATDPVDALEAMFITDSDNDAAIYVFTEENENEALRPNTCTLYPVTAMEDESAGTGILYSLDGYLPETASLIATITTLEACP